MEADIKDGTLGQVGTYDIEFKQGNLTAAIKGDFGIGTFDGRVSLDSDKVMDAIAAKVPGKIDDTLLGFIKAALKS